MSVSTVNEEQIIESVRKFPCLFAISSPEYHDMLAKENAWKAVAEECASEIDTAKKIWRQIRDN